MHTILDLVEEHSTKWRIDGFRGTLNEMSPMEVVLHPIEDPEDPEPSVACSGNVYKYVIATKLGTEFFAAVAVRFPGTRLVKVNVDLSKPIQLGANGWRQTEISAMDILSSLETE